MPHHLVAADLIARAFQMVDASRIDTVVVLVSRSLPAVAAAVRHDRRAFDTAFGRIEATRPTFGGCCSRTRWSRTSICSERPRHRRDPALRQALSSVRALVPVAVSIAPPGTTGTGWRRPQPQLRPTALIVQSTDFSHYLPLHDAVRRDQEVLNILAADDARGMARLRQPQPHDSRGSQYLQMRLQRDVFGARPAVLSTPIRRPMRTSR